MYGKSSRHPRGLTNCERPSNSHCSMYWMCAIVSSLKLKSLHRFTSTASAVEDYTALKEGKLGKGLKQFLSDEIVEKGKGKETLLVADPKLGKLRSSL